VKEDSTRAEAMCDRAPSVKRQCKPTLLIIRQKPLNNMVNPALLFDRSATKAPVFDSEYMLSEAKNLHQQH
jgi:hypothetical protein